MKSSQNKTIPKRQVFTKGSLKYDLVASLNYYVNQAGDDLNPHREKDILSIKQLLQNIKSRPLFMHRLENYLENLDMPCVCVIPLFGYREHSKLRSLLRKVMKFHEQETIIARQNKKISAQEATNKMMIKQQTKAIQSLKEGYESKIHDLESKLLATQSQVNQIYEYLNKGQPLVVGVQEVAPNPVMDQAEVIYELQQENDKLRLKFESLLASKNNRQVKKRSDKPVCTILKENMIQTTGVTARHGIVLRQCGEA